MNQDTYLRYKKKYIQLKQKGGDMNENDFKRIEIHNRNVYFDKGNNNIWMEKKKDIATKELDSVKINDVTPEQFTLYLDKTMKDRYYVRDTNLTNLLGVMKTTYGDIKNINFIEDFYVNLFKGTSHKQYFPLNSTITDDITKRYNVHIEYEEIDGKLPIKRHYTFTDNSNPCHLIKIMKDVFKRNEDNKQSQIDYAFTNIRELGRGKAGIASLFGYYNDETNGKLQIAAKLMASNQFDVTNSGKYLPLQILYIDPSVTKISISRTDKNMRWICSPQIIKDLNKSYDEYEKFNIFKIEDNKYSNVMLSVASDNFSNQTIMHMILQNILEPFGNNNFIKQYDALLCYNTVTEFTESSWYEFLKSNTYYAANMIGNALNYKNASIDGLNFMEIANGGDLYGHLFEIQKERFSKIRTTSDLDKENNFENLGKFLNTMIIQLLKPLSILQHPRYSFIHGDLKTKNVFVNNTSNGFVYKIADYDKSSITYNGIRFYNEGNTAVKMVNKLFPPSLYQEHSDITIGSNDSDKSYSTYFKSNPIIPTFSEEYINKLLKDENKGNDVISVIHDLILNYLNKKDIPIKDRIDTIRKILRNVNQTNEFHMKKLNEYIEKIYYKVIDTYNINKYSTEQSIKDEKIHIGEIMSMYTHLNEINDTKDINLFYTLNSVISKLSMFINKLENIEMEQLYVRYSPLPFYHTIDLYTLFLSLLQSPMVYTFISYCLMNKEKDTVKKNIFWLSFKDLWIADSDIYAILGYYNYLYKNPTLDDVSSIGFILDPIKKNPISLIKKVRKDYWERCWDNNEYNNNNNKIIPNDNYSTNTLKLSAGGLLTMPQICVSECGDFDMKVHRGSTVYYLNKDLIVYSATGIGEQITAINSTQTALDKSFKDKYKVRIRLGIIKYISKKITDKSKIPSDMRNTLKLNNNKTTTSVIPEPVQLVIDEQTKINIKNKISDDNYVDSDMPNKPRPIPENLMLNITNIISKSSSGWAYKKWYINHFVRNDVEKFITEKFPGINNIIKTIIVNSSNGTYKLDNSNSPILNEIIQQIISATNGIAEQLDQRELDEEYTKEIHNYKLELDEYKSTLINKLINNEEQRIQKLNEEKQQNYDNEIKKFKIEQDKEMVDDKSKYDKIIENLNKDTTLFDNYVDKVFSKNDNHNKNLFNICKTNTYKDVFGNDMNWDFCIATDEEIKNILDEVQLF